MAKASGIKQTQHSDFVTLTPTDQPRRSCSSSPSTGLNNFYAPKLAKPARKADRVQLLQADRVAEPYTSKLEKNEQGFNDLASLIGTLIADLAKESQEAKVEDDHSQKDYAAFVSEFS